MATIYKNRDEDKSINFSSLKILIIACTSDLAGYKR